MVSYDNRGHRERLRNRLLKSSGEALEDYELIEMILFAAVPRADTKLLAKSVYNNFKGDLRRVFGANLDDLIAIKGITKAMASSILCVSEFCRRINGAKAKKRSLLNKKFSLHNFDDVLLYVKSKIAFNKKESLHLIYLNSVGFVIADEVSKYGTIDSVVIYVRQVLEKIMLYGAKSLVMAHNHPSGLVEPSEADLRVTRSLQTACVAIDVHLIDHVIVSHDDYFSFYKNGLIKN